MRPPRKPDYYAKVPISTDKGDKQVSRWMRIGGAWENDESGTISVTLFGLPVEGKFILVPNDEKT